MKQAKQTNRFWGERPLPKTKAEFFDAVTTPAPTGTGTVATIRLYGPVDSWGGYWGISTKDVGQVLDALPDSVTQIILRINSPGGEAFEAIAILNMFRAHKATVTAVVDGLAASAASIIAAGCDETVMSPGTQMMIHSPSSIVWGNAAEMRKAADTLDGIEASIVEVYIGKAGEQDWAALLAEETWLTAQESVELGLADRVAVIPDAGEAETVGEEEPVIVVVPLEGDDTEDSYITQIAAFARDPKTPVSPEPGNQEEEDIVSYNTLKAGLRERLGMTDAEVSDEAALAALDEALAERAEPEAATVATLPDGALVVDKAVHEQLVADAAKGRQAMETIDTQRRDGIITAALGDGRIAPAGKQSWRDALDENEERTKALLESMPKNTVPVTELGHGDDTKSTGDQLAAKAGWTDTEKGA
jgi:ATP-dependent protease ClpP protease subunit